jgi:peptide/nickel transport system ATP-binding protein
MEAPLAGDPPNPINPPEGCRFHPRCPQAQTVCSKVKPVLARTGEGARQAACHMQVAGSGHSCAPNPEEAA